MKITHREYWNAHQTFVVAACSLAMLCLMRPSDASPQIPAIERAGSAKTATTFPTDPGIEFSTFLGGSDLEQSPKVLLDSHENVLIVGMTSSLDFPTTPGVFSPTAHGGTDIFITKLSADGRRLIFSTVFGGTGLDIFTGVALDQDDNILLTGETFSPDFPTTPGAFSQTLQGPTDAFVTKLSADGSTLLFSTLLGGSGEDLGSGVATDREGNVLIAGISGAPANGPPDFPTTPEAFDPTFNGHEDVFVTKLTADGSKILFSTFLGGSGSESFSDQILAVDVDGSVVVAGGTSSPDFPTTMEAFDQTLNETSTLGDVFVAKLTADGSGLLFSTFLGGLGGDTVRDMALDPEGNVLIAGMTRSPDFPTTPNAFNPTFRGGVCDNPHVFVSKLSSGGDELLFSTFLGQIQDFSPSLCETPDSPGIALPSARHLGIVSDRVGNVVITGPITIPDFPTTPGAFDTTLNANSSSVLRGDAFVTRLSADGSTLLESTFLGGKHVDAATSIVLDAEDQAVIVGETISPEFPLTPGAWDTTPNGGLDIFVTKIDLQPFEVDAPDLTAAITTLKMKINKKGEEVLKFTIKVGNTGNRKAKGPFTVMAFLAADEAGNDADDLLLETWTIPQLRKGDIAQLKWKIGNFSPSPDQFLVVRLDAEDEIAEVDETNNVVSRQISVIP